MKKLDAKALKNNAFRAVKMVFVGFTATCLVLGATACRPYEAVKSTLAEDAIPPMPAPEVTTYVLDLSGSTNPTAQLEALGSGISDFIAGRSLGNPFAKIAEAPRGLSIQFITTNAAQAPRIVLVSTKTSQDLYNFITNNVPNLEGSKQLWDGLINARTQIWQDSTLEANLAGCVGKVVQSLGKQQLLPDALQEPARLTRIPGVGKKTAERLLLELKGKLGADLGAAGGAAPDVNTDILNALVALGYSDKEAMLAVKQVPAGSTVTEGIRQALKALSKG